METEVTAEDYCAVSNFFARYFRFVDLNRAEQWLELWTDDGTIALGAQSFAGRDELKGIPQMSHDLSGGKMCHSFTNLSCEYGADRDSMIAEFYEMVTNWQSGGAFQMLGICRAELVRSGAGWKMRRNDVTPLR